MAASIGEQVKSFSPKHQREVVRQGDILLENGMVHVVMRAGANQSMALEKTPGMNMEQGAQLSVS